MKNFKKLTALLLALVMVFALSVSAFAETTVVTAQDESVLKLESTGNTVSYMATTVDGGEKDGVIYPATTTYTYSIKTANDSATITATVGSAASYIKVNGTKLTGNTFTLNKNTHNTVVAYTARNKEVRSFDITVVDATSVNVTIEINCYNAKQFIKDNPTSAAATAYDLLNSRMKFNDNGKMSTVVSLSLPAGSTAMDALYALKAQKGFSITGTGSATGTAGTVYTYISGIDGLGEKMCGSWSGWCFVSTMPNATYEMPSVGAASYSLTEGEHITWVYTCTFTDIEKAIKG